MTKFKKGQVSVTRARQMADSLSNVAKKQAIYAGNVLQDKDVIAGKYPYLKQGALKNAQLSNINTIKADRYRANADKAMAAANAKLKAQAGRDKPLPSSDGILSTIKNWFE